MLSCSNLKMNESKSHETHVPAFGPKASCGKGMRQPHGQRSIEDGEAPDQKRKRKKRPRGSPSAQQNP